MFSVTVIIPVFNAEKFISSAIESALVQEEVTEIILIEDGSDDNSLKICKDYSSKFERVKLFQHKNGENKGCSVSRNIGIKNAKNDIIAFLDADDYYLPGRFKKDKEIFEKEINIDGVYNAVAPYAADKNGKDRLKIYNNELLTMKASIRPQELFFNMDPIGQSGYFQLDGFTVKRKAMIEIGLFDPYLRLSQDTHAFIKLSAKYKLVSGVINRPVAMYTYHKNNRSQFKDKLESYHYYLYKSCYDWACNETITSDKILILWEKYYKAALKEFELKKLTRSKFLGKSILHNPSLLRSRTFRGYLPLFNRF